MVVILGFKAHFPFALTKPEHHHILLISPPFSHAQITRPPCNRCQPHHLLSYAPLNIVNLDAMLGRPRKPHIHEILNVHTKIKIHLQIWIFWSNV